MKTQFLIISLDLYFTQANKNQNASDQTKLMFAKLVKNDEHIEFAKRLFNFLVKIFINKIDLQSKTQEYKESYNSAVRVLKKII
jgi:hypothetical protein